VTAPPAPRAPTLDPDLWPRLLGGLAVACLPGTYLLLSAWLAWRAQRYAARTWPNERAELQRKAEEAALSWEWVIAQLRERLAATDRRLEDALARIEALESAQGKLRRAMRARNLTDSTEALSNR
jgi:hypothetical protein